MLSRIKTVNAKEMEAFQDNDGSSSTHSHYALSACRIYKLRSRALDKERLDSVSSLERYRANRRVKMMLSWTTHGMPQAISKILPFTFILFGWNYVLDYA